MSKDKESPIKHSFGVNIRKFSVIFVYIEFVIKCLKLCKIECITYFRLTNSSVKKIKLLNL